MKTFENINIKPYNTFGINVKASILTQLNDVDEIINSLKIKTDACIPKLIIGGGSNLLFTKDFIGIIYYPLIKTIDIISDKNDKVLIKVGCGVVWDEFVAYCVNNDYYGIENMSLIPGNVGATPVQNIGAFGVEVKDVISKISAIDMTTGEKVEFSNRECQFSYRHSFFKLPQNLNRYLITHVYFSLSKKPEFKTHYGNLEDELKNFNQINIKNIRQAIIKIRERKLPDPTVLGNAGSFFKNPVVSKEKAEKIINKYPDCPSYPEKDKIKLAAGWMIDKCGWKGYRKGDAGVHKNQALVLVNYGNATGTEIYSLAQKIQESVKTTFDIKLEPEVRII